MTSVHRPKPGSFFLFTAAALVLASVVAVTPARAEESCGDLLIVLDRSGSMAKCTIGGVTKQEIAKTAIKSVISKYATVPMGLFAFPDIGGSCTKGREMVPLAADGAMKVSTWLDGMGLASGGTPTGVTMEVVKDYMSFTPGRTHFVLLLTDGVPTCDDGTTDDADGGVKDCNGGGCEECKNPSKVYDSIKALYDRGIHTFVIGFDADMADCGTPLPTCGNGAMPAPLTLNADTLNKMAENGGEAVDGPKKYYSANDPTSLNDALNKILGKVKGGTIGGCTSSGGGGGSGMGSGGMSGAGGSGEGGQGGAGAEGGDGGGRRANGGAGCLCTAGTAAPGAGLLLVLALGAWVARIRRRG